jgi:hypothetical protein
MEIDVRINIIVHAITIIAFDGVQSGRIIVLYQDLPVSAKYEAADAVIITNRGMKKKFGLILVKRFNLFFID